MSEYVVPDGMPRSVFENKYSRRKADGTMQSYAERVREVVHGNFLLDPRRLDADAFAYKTMRNELTRTEDLSVAGIMPFSGRHLQHGDGDQPNRLLELHSNCSTTLFSFQLFRLLLRGSGVGRDYSAACCRVDWDQMPNIRLVLDSSHADFKPTEFNGYLEPLRDARHKYDSESETVRWFTVGDSREAWAKLIEILETAAWQGKHADKLFVFDFSEVRPQGSAIAGLQGRPASGPVPLMNALCKIANIKGAGMKPWKQALFIDHYLAECVVWGGARRSARMATKHWRDRDAIEFIDIKRGGFLWSANNSLLVDATFWEQAKQPQHTHARRVFEAASNAAYWDKTGEPGFINVDKLNGNIDGLEMITGETCIDPEVYGDLHPRTMDMIDNVVTHVKKLPYHFITNPCQPGFAPVMTRRGMSTIGQIEIGDEIWSEDGWVSVINKWSTGLKKVMRYRTTSGVVYSTENHRIVENGLKIEVQEAECIDRLNGPDIECCSWSPQAIMDGLVIGDGSVHSSSACPVYLTIGAKDQDYFNSEIASLIVGDHAVKYGVAYKITTTLTSDELDLLPNRVIPCRYVNASPQIVASFLRGLYSANGSVVTAGSVFRVTLKTTSSAMVEQVQVMLSSLGFSSFFTTNKKTSITWDNGTYVSKESYDVNLAGRYGERFMRAIGFLQEYKMTKLAAAIVGMKRIVGDRKIAYPIVSAEYLGEMEVFDIHVSGKSHTYWSGGCNVSNCGEIVLSLWGGLCIIGDINLSRVENPDDAIEAARLMARFLIRCNLMKSEYSAEVKRTNRIGVSLTGVHEFAWTYFGLTFHDLIRYWHGVYRNGSWSLDATAKTHKAHKFWLFIEHMRLAVEESAIEFSRVVGLPTPHTMTTIKPSGTISKVMNCTEGVHLPALAYYLRWTMYLTTDPDIALLRDRGYPVKDVSHRYAGHVVVGFPTRQPLADLMGDKIVTADETTMEENFRWLQLLENFWLGADRENNQVSYTLKYDANKVSYLDFMATILEWQPQIRCCAGMPHSDWRESEKVYGYVPEQPITREEYEALMAGISAPVVRERYDAFAMDCETGACPIEPDVNRLALTDGDN